MQKYRPAFPWILEHQDQILDVLHHAERLRASGCSGLPPAGAISGSGGLMPVARFSRASVASAGKCPGNLRQTVFRRVQYIGNPVRRAPFESSVPSEIPWRTHGFTTGCSTSTSFGTVISSTRSRTSTSCACRSSDASPDGGVRPTGGAAYGTRRREKFHCFPPAQPATRP